MAREMVTEGAEELARMLEKAGAQAQGIASQGLYVGAGIVADAIASGAENIKTAEFKFARDGQMRLPSPEELDVIRGASGVSHFEKNGAEVSTHVGYANAGYAELKGKQVPIALIVNSINSGTSFMKKQPFLRRSVNKVKGQASAAIEQEIETRLNKLTGGNE